MLGIRRGFLRRYSNFWKKLTEVLISLCSVRSMANYSTSSPGKMGHFLISSAKLGWLEETVDLTLISSTQHLQLCLKGMWVLLYVILFPHFWYHKKICSSVAHHYLCILKIHQKDLRWRGRSLSQCLSSESLCETRHWCMRKSCWWSW